MRGTVKQRDQLKVLVHSNLSSPCFGRVDHLFCYSTVEPALMQKRCGIGNDETQVSSGGIPAMGSHRPDPVSLAYKAELPTAIRCPTPYAMPSKMPPSVDNFLIQFEPSTDSQIPFPPPIVNKPPP